MKNPEKKPIVERKKKISIMALFIISAIIILLGALLSVFSFATNINFTVLGSQIHGSIFGIIITFLGVRYFLSVQKLKTEVYKTTSKFSWSNFKKEKTKSAFSKSKQQVLR